MAAGTPGATLTESLIADAYGVRATVTYPRPRRPAAHPLPGHGHRDLSDGVPSTGGRPVPPSSTGHGTNVPLNSSTARGPPSTGATRCGQPQAFTDPGGLHRQLIVEAVVENTDAKTEISAVLDKIVEAPDAVLATNTSSLPVMRLGMATNHADHVLGLHFFNPARTAGRGPPAP